ncbi:hypothetical protein DH2020_047069 [Rehmannia glutinosa]|uniref:Helicase C-terminal domain-containing protein n=1 Tax=Rehmannia glutinosa TaxID=99300 RepID=A0ABR0U9J2_REHGL
MDLTSSIGKDTNDGLKKLKSMLDPFVHVHKGTILKESLPGLRDTLVFLHPTELQKNLLEASTKTRNIFHRVREVSLVSVHPSLMLTKKLSPDLKSELEEIEKDIDAGIKSRFSWKEGRELLYMDGQLDEKQRQDSICSFNDDKSESKVLLASERACSEGINLIGASRVVLLDTVWNPSVEKQAVSRAYRIGQKKVVYVYRLFTSGTEVGQYAQQVQKERMSQLIFSPGDGETCRDDVSLEVSEDKVLEAMLGHERFSRIFEKIIRSQRNLI